MLRSLLRPCWVFERGGSLPCSNLTPNPAPPGLASALSHTQPRPQHQGVWLGVGKAGLSWLCQARCRPGQRSDRPTGPVREQASRHTHLARLSPPDFHKGGALCAERRAGTERGKREEKQGTALSSLPNTGPHASEVPSAKTAPQSCVPGPEGTQQGIQYAGPPARDASPARSPRPLPSPDDRGSTTPSGTRQGGACICRPRSVHTGGHAEPALPEDRESFLVLPSTVPFCAAHRSLFVFPGGLPGWRPQQ